MLRAWLYETDRNLVAGDFVRAEPMRTVRRVEPERVLREREVLDSVHVAAALDLGEALEGLVTYDDRLARAAQTNAITAIGPL